MLKYMLLALFWVSHTYSLEFIISQKPQNPFWYHQLFKQYFCTQLTGRGVVVAILDGVVSDRSAMPELAPKNKHNLKNSTIKPIKINLSEVFVGSGELIKDLSDRWSKKVPQNYQEQYGMLGQHAFFSLYMLWLLAPEVTVYVVPIFQSDGTSTKQCVLRGLQQASKLRPDIVYAGFEIFDYDPEQRIDQQILKLCNSFDYIVAPCGNVGQIYQKPGFPASCSNVISVAACGQQGNIPRYCQCSTLFPVQYVMPGDCMGMPMHDGSIIYMSGTCVAAVGMVAILSLVLQSSSKKAPAELIEMLQKNCVYLSSSWKDKVQYGLPDLKQLLATNV